METSSSLNMMCLTRNIMMTFGRITFSKKREFLVWSGRSRRLGSECTRALKKEGDKPATVKIKYAGCVKLDSQLLTAFGNTLIAVIVGIKFI
jgi:hypothetical protein